MKAILAATLFCGLGSMATATEIDLSKMTCQQFLQTSKNQTGIIMTWLDGYFHDENNPPIIDTEEFATDAKSLTEYCTANPTVTVAAAAEKVFGGKYCGPTVRINDESTGDLRGDRWCKVHRIGVILEGHDDTSPPP